MMIRGRGAWWAPALLALCGAVALSSLLSSRVSSALLSQDSAIDAMASLDLSAEHQPTPLPSFPPSSTLSLPHSLTSLRSSLSSLGTSVSSLRNTNQRLVRQRSVLTGGEKDAIHASNRLALSPPHPQQQGALIAQFQARVRPTNPPGARLHHSILTGWYVRACNEEGEECYNTYQHEKDEDFKMTPRNNTAYRFFGLPLGNQHQEPISAYNPAQNDIIPKEMFSGSNVVGYGSSDRFVPYDFSSIAPTTNVPPWKKQVKIAETKAREKAWEDSLPVHQKSEYHVICPLNETTGYGCVMGSDGVDGITEATYFSEGYGAGDRDEKLNKLGVNVDSWPISNTSRHRWTYKGEDKPPPSPPQFEAKGLKHPQWAYENWAMKSQGYTPEGQRNLDLVKGRLGEYDEETGVADKFLTKSKYSKQLQVEHEGELDSEDHFADWEPKSKKNRELVYGMSHTLAGQRWDEVEHKYVHDGWTLWNNSVPVSEAQSLLSGPARLLKFVRTGDVLRDSFLPQGWEGANGVDGLYNNLDHQPDPQPQEPQGMGKLDGLGVNI